MPKINLQAIPRLIPPPNVIAPGIERTPDEWSEAIAGLRPRLLALGYRELCGLLQGMYLHDLFCLVVNTPYSHDLLARLQAGLSEPVWEILRADCEKQGAALLGDLASAVYARVNEALTALEESHATKEQQDQLLALSRQMLELEDSAFKLCMDDLSLEPLNALFCVTGGLESEWSQRARQFLGKKEWEMFEEDYPDTVAEPIKSDTVVECLANLPGLRKRL